MISKEVFAKSMEMIEKRTSQSKGTKSQALFSRKVYCGHCGYKKKFEESKEKVKGNKQNRFIEKFHKYGGIESLDRKIVEELIERIDVYDEKHIKVSVKYKDEYVKLILLVQKI